MSKRMVVVAMGVAVTVGMALGPTGVGAHVGDTVGHLWKDHIKPKVSERHYTKSQSDNRYARKGSNASAHAFQRSVPLSDSAFSTVVSEQPGSGYWFIAATTTIENSGDLGDVRCRLRNVTDDVTLARGGGTVDADSGSAYVGHSSLSLTHIAFVGDGDRVAFQCRETTGPGVHSATENHVNFVRVNAPG